MVHSHDERYAIPALDGFVYVADTFRPDTFWPDKAALRNIARAHVICPFKCGSTEQIKTLQVTKHYL